MRVVLYADDMEPITVIDLSTQAEEYLKLVKLFVRGKWFDPDDEVMEANHA